MRSKESRSDRANGSAAHAGALAVGGRARVLALCACVVLAGCRSSWLAAAPVYGGASRAFGGGLVQVDWLARGVLRPAEAPPPRFRYYAYLLFLDRTPATQLARKAAADAFLRLLTVPEAKAEGAKPENMALLLAPLRALERVERCDGPEVCAGELLADYDYDRAKRIVRAAGGDAGKLPRLLLIGAEQRFDDRSRLDPGQVWAVSLDVPDAATVEARIEQFHNSLVMGGEPAKPAQDPGWLARVREFFAVVGSTIRDLVHVTSAS